MAGMKNTLTQSVLLAGDHLYGKLLFSWLSLVMSMMVDFVLSFYSRDVLDEILNLIESVPEGFPTYSYILALLEEIHRLRVPSVFRAVLVTVR